MNFFNFAELSTPDIPIKPSKNTRTITNKNSNPIPTVKNVKTIEQNYHRDYHNLYKGDCVQIIHLENSQLNMFKGYIGEIKEYKRGNDNAMIFLYALPYYKLIRMPISHFKKIL